MITGTAVVLLRFAAYWVRGRGGHRPTGTWEMAAVLTSFALAFAAEQLTGSNPVLYACYMLICISCLGYTAKDFLPQTRAQSKRSTRRSQRWGLRTTSAGCGFAPVHAAYKLFTLVSIGFGLGLVPEKARWSTPLSPFRCTFSVTAPAVAVLLVTVGLTLPALLWPLSPLRRPRWERNSFTALEPLWREVTAQVPEVVLDPGNTGADAEVEAAVIAAAVDAKRTGLPLDGDEAPPAAGTPSRKGDLPAETAWLLLVADAPVRRPARENAGVAS
ncbi:DUF6545 domain-containing protein [Streptomyces violascens]|uniref:DUF6545 domain-containing protein n=1 Tax=Streptomyces violascens TaxID=67381 RepID=UPI00367B7C19